MKNLVIQGDFNALDETINFGSRQFAVGDGDLYAAYTKLTVGYDCQVSKIFSYSYLQLNKMHACSF